MRYRLLSMTVSFLLISSIFGMAQDTISVDSNTLNQHVLQRVPLAYPAIARAAHVQGTVVLQVQVGVDGKVASAVTISGPSMLRQAAIDSVRQWTFKPFKKAGSTIRASGRISLVFLLAGLPPPPEESPEKIDSPKPPGSVTIVRIHVAHGTDGTISNNFFHARHECIKQMAEKKNLQETAATCKKAADIADQFAPNAHYIDKRFDFLDAAVALKNSGDLVAGLVYATKAVDVTNLGHDIDFGSSQAYLTKGSIEFYLGDLSAADEDLKLSEQHERKAIAWTKSEAPNNLSVYKKVLGLELRFHANVSLHLNHAAEAKEELAEASKL